ncbi:MAG: quinone-dependent dihydroorotate dehydrogenase [Bacteroidales bacterium]
MYKFLIRPFLFNFNAEAAHNLTFSLLTIVRHIPLGRAIMRLFYKHDSPELAKDVFGIHFPNPVGLAAGLDKNGDHYNELSDCGFGFVEIGSITPGPQPGNPKPRLFRIPKDYAIINRMGINNCGVRKAIDHIQNNPPEGIIAVSLAKSTSSESEEAAIKDFGDSFSLMYDFADMFVLNISCPNVQGVEALQDVDTLSDIVDNLLSLRLTYDNYKPILLKLSPDLPHSQVDDILDYCMMSGVDGIVASNTTRSRDGLTIPDAKIKEIGNGGLSGAPLFPKSLALVKYIHAYTKGRLPIVGVGGIMSPEEAKAMFDAGASLIEIYSSFIYNGPSIVKKILKSMETK